MPVKANWPLVRMRALQVNAPKRIGGAAHCVASPIPLGRWNDTSIRNVRIVETIDQTGDITDIVTVLRGVGFAAISPQAGDSASLLHYCVTHAADEIERLRLTNDERAAIAFAIEYLQPVGNYDNLAQLTLRRLLERTA